MVLPLSRPYPSGSRLATQRVLAGLSQLQLAERAGLTPSTVADIERGVNKGRITTWRRLADALDLSISDFIEGERLGTG